MTPPPTLVASALSTGTLAATELDSIPTGVSVVGILALLAWWLTKRMDRMDDTSDARVKDLQREIEELRATTQLYVDQKHASDNRIVTLVGERSLIRIAAVNAGAIDIIKLLDDFDVARANKEHHA